jgi:hypothetical protein
MPNKDPADRSSSTENQADGDNTGAGAVTTAAAAANRNRAPRIANPTAPTNHLLESGPEKFWSLTPMKFWSLTPNAEG